MRIERRRIMNKEFYVYWYDMYDDEHKSKVYHIDANRDRFLVVTEDGFFKWVDTDNCKIVTQ